MVSKIRISVQNQTAESKIAHLCLKLDNRV